MRLPGAVTNGAMMFAVAIAEGDNLAAFEMLTAAISEVVASFLRRGRRAVAVDDGKLEQLVLRKLMYRVRKNPLDAAIGLPASHHPVDTRAVDFGGGLSHCFRLAASSTDTPYRAPSGCN